MGNFIPQIDATEVKKAIDARKNFVLLDVRTPEEFAKGNIAGSVNLPVDQVQEKVVQTLPDKSKIMYVYCLSGSRSAQAVTDMIKLGYSQVYSMTSGLLAWRAKKYPTQ